MRRPRGTSRARTYGGDLAGRKTARRHSRTVAELAADYLQGLAMKAIRVALHGGPEVLKLADVEPIEKPGPGQAVVRVVAAGVNFMDVGQRRGSYPREVPFTPGAEGAGVVESVGEGGSRV